MTSSASKPVIRIIHNLGRTGGTLICRCLGSMRNIVLLSEIHPTGSLGNPEFNPVVQAQQWYGLFTADDIASAQQNPNLDFPDVIDLISRRCSEQNRVLLIRDWTQLDFLAVPFLSAPCHRLTIIEALRERFNIIQTTTVRHPIGQWLSLNKVPLIQGRLSFDDFLYGYRQFAEHCARIGFTRYEDFVRHPEAKTQELCERLNIAYDPGFLFRWSSYDRITGDRAAMDRKEIKVPPRKPVNPGLLALFKKNSDYQASLELLGYTHPDK